MEMITSAPRAASSALAARLAPSLSSACMALSIRSKTVTLWPALTRLLAMGAPMLPRPIKAIFMVVLLVIV